MAYTYDMIVIGGGSAGLTAAGMSASFGAKTLLVEADRLGGDCTWTGCIPSKTLLRGAKLVRQMRHAGRYGLVDTEPPIDFPRMMEHVRQVREQVYREGDTPGIYEAMGVEVKHGEAAFIEPHTLQVLNADGTSGQVTGRYIVIATGSRPLILPIEGIEEVPYWTTESLFEISELPEQLAVIGAGSIGTEMAQAFRRFGAEVTVIDRLSRILADDDEELASMLQESLQEEGVQYVLNARVQRVSHDSGIFHIEAAVDGDPRVVEADALLMATGQKPNVDRLDLKTAGVAYSTSGIQIDKRCRTTIRHIYAVGDVTGRYQFTHMAEHMAKVAVSSALVKAPRKVDDDHVPWCTYTSPELAHVGASQMTLEERSIPYEVYRFPYEKLDRAMTDGAPDGLIKVLATRRTGKILGVSMLAGRAGDLISEYALAMKNGITLRQMADTIHPYPTYGRGNRRAADQWYVRLLKPWMVRLLKKVFGYRGKTPEHNPTRIV